MYVVEYKVYIIIITTGKDMLLSVHEGKTSSQFHDELLEIVYQSLFQLRFIIFCVFSKAEKFCDDRILNILKWVCLFNHRLGQSQ